MSQENLVKFADEVAGLLQAIMQKFLKKQIKEVAQGNISLPQVLILEALTKRPLLRMGELAKYLSVSMAAATGIADTLVKSGFVTRESSTRDRRIVNIAITSRGRRMVEKYNHTRQQAFIEIFGHLSAHDRARYLEILKKIHSHIT